MTVITRVLGIDPGANGGIAVIESGELTLAKKTLPCDLTSYNLDWIALEQVGADHRASSAKLMRNYGQWEIHASHACSRVHYIRPQRWQYPLHKQFGGLAGLYGPPRKRRLKQIADEIFPDMKLTMATCDAALIAFVSWKYLQST